MRALSWTSNIALGFGVIFFFTSVQSFAFSKRDRSYQANAYYSNYTDLKISDSEEVKPELPGSIELEVGVRLHTIFTFILTYGMAEAATDSTTGEPVNKRVYFGPGLKVGLPGFFFLGSSRRDSSRRMKKHPVNTFIYGQVLQSTEIPDNGAKYTTAATRYGFGMDIFLFNRYTYFSLALGTMSFDGDTYLSTNVGLGINF